MYEDYATHIHTLEETNKIWEGELMSMNEYFPKIWQKYLDIGAHFQHLLS